MAASGPIDVLIVVALEDELDAVLAEGGGADGWRELRDHVQARTLGNEAGQTLGVAAVWTGAMGATATATRAARLVAELQPACLAMCGICAGKRGDVALGDVIVADRVYSFDHGKLVAAHDGKPASFFHDIETYNLERSWRLSAAAFRRDLDWAKALLPRRPPTRDAQRRWLLRAVLAHERDGGPPPLAHPERAAMFRTAVPGVRDWADTIVALRVRGLLDATPAAMQLTESGRRAAQDDHLLHPDGAPGDPAFQVHVGPIATGNAVIEDPKIFDRLKLVGRKTLGVEMEAFAIGHVGDALGQRAIVVKAVSDHADHDKDDRFREFACHASASWLFAFLRKHLVPGAADARAAVTGPPRDPGPRSPFPELSTTRREESPVDDRKEIWGRGIPEIVLAGHVHRASGLGELHQRVERALALRHPERSATWKCAIDPVPAALRVFLEIREPRGRHTVLRVVAAVDGDVEEATLDAFLEHIVKRYGADQSYLEPSVVYTGAVSAAVADRAGRMDVQLVPLLELQGLLDFRPYLEHQMSRLDGDPVYPPGLFVPQTVAYQVACEEFKAPDALETVDAWFRQDGPQLLLVLGDFGTGKTFLMHELARKLGRRHLETGRTVVPILVELRKLEKSRSLDALLGQHFIPERGMRRFDHDAFRYMLDEGRVALLFDGFDELALRVTYAAAAEHLETVLQAAIGKAKVMITSRTQHFLNDQQVLQALGKHAEERGFRLMRLLPFDVHRIHQFLVNRFGDPSIARQRFELLGEVKDLLGLSHNPRMLGFIAEIDEQDLRAAAKGGAITSATLYRVLLGKWLGHEVERDHPPGIESGASEAARWKAASELAKLLWTRKERTISVGEIPPEILDEVSRLSERPVSRDAAAFKIGSATLLCRDEDGRFSFIHQSIVEWLVASAMADELRAGGTADLLSSAEMSDLMADFLCGLAGDDATWTWVLRVLDAPPTECDVANGNRVVRRLNRDLSGRSSVVRARPSAGLANLSGHDVRGQDLSRARHLRGASLVRANLSEASLVEADLSNAALHEAKLRRTNLSRAQLAGADLTGADLSFARLLGADLVGAKLAGARFHYTALVGARVEPDSLSQADLLGVAPPRPGDLDVTIGAPFMACAAVAFSPDGAILAAGYADGTVVLWDRTSGRPLRGLEGHTGGVTSVAFSPGGRVLASASHDKRVLLWGLDTGKVLHVLEGHTDGVAGVAWSSDGRVLASASSDATVRLWRPDTGELVRVLRGHTGGVAGVAWSSDGRVLASASDDTTVRLWRPDTGELVRAVASHLEAITSVALSPNGRALATASDDKTIHLWNPDTGELRTFEAQPSRVTSVAFSPDGNTLAAASDRAVQLWNPDTGKVLRTLERHSGLVRNVAFSPDGHVVASASYDKTIRLWNAHTGKLLRSLEGHACWVRCVAFSPDGRVLASGSYDDIVRLWNPSTGQLLHALEGHSGWVTSLAFSPDGRLLASGSNDDTILLWSPDTGKPLRALEGHLDPVMGIAFSPDGRVLASASTDKTVRLWNPHARKLMATLEGHARRVAGVAFSPDGRVLASASDDHTVRLWHPDHGALVRVLEGHSHSVRSVAFSSDGRVLASASDDHTVRLWSLDTGDLVRSLEGHSDWVRTVAFSPDGRVIASASADHTIRLWSTATGDLLHTLTGHAGWVTGAAFSHGGRVLASTSSDKTIRLWSVEAALRRESAWLATIVPARGGWAAYTPDGRYKVNGESPSVIGFTVGLCRFEPGELDAYPDAFDHPPRRIGDDEPLFTLDP